MRYPIRPFNAWQEDMLREHMRYDPATFTLTREDASRNAGPIVATQFMLNNERFSRARVIRFLLGREDAPTRSRLLLPPFPLDPTSVEPQPSRTGPDAVARELRKLKTAARNAQLRGITRTADLAEYGDQKRNRKREAMASVNRAQRAPPAVARRAERTKARQATYDPVLRAMGIDDEFLE